MIYLDLPYQVSSFFGKGVVMTTEHIIYIFVLYMGLNVIYDWKYQITKNYFHYPIAILLLMVSSWTGQFNEVLFSGLGALVFFIFVRNLPIMTFGAGDVKMLVNLFMFMNLVSIFDPLYTFMTTLALYLLVSQIGELLIRTFKKNWKGRQVHPEAPFIFVSMMFLILLFN